MKKLRVLFVLGLIIMTSTALQAKKVELKFNLKKGQVFVLAHTMKQEIAQEAMGQSMVMENEIVTKYSFKVLEIREDGNYLMEEQVVGVKMVMENDFANINYDSETGDDPPPGMEIMTKTMDIPFTFVLSPNGEVVEMVDTEKYLAVIEKLMGRLAGPEMQMLSGLISQSSSKEGLQTQAGALFFKYPKGKTKVGDSWSDESETTQMVKFTNLIENTLVEADKEKATIKQVVDIKMQDMEGMEVQGMTMNYELSGKKQGAYQVDLDTGLIVNAETTTDISGVISVESPQLASPMSMPMSIKMTETVIQVK